jgi:hypothetical protein
MDCGMPTTTRQYTAECQLLGKIWPRNATDRTVPLLNFPRSTTNRATVLSPWHSAVHIWERHLAKDWIPAPAILDREPPCLLRHKFLTRDFPGVSPIHGELFRSKLYTKGLSWHSISWHYPFNTNSKFYYFTTNTVKREHTRTFSSKLIHILVLKIPKVSNILRNRT